MAIPLGECSHTLFLIMVVLWTALRMEGLTPVHSTVNRPLMTDFESGRWDSDLSIDGEYSKKTNYVLTLRYNGQQSAGVRSLLSQQCWIGSYNLSMFVVEPFLRDSYVEALPDQTANRTLMMRDFFDMEHLSNATKSLGYAQLASWPDFVENAPHKIIYIQMKNADKWELNHTEVPTVIWNASTKEQCYIPTQPGYSARISSLIHNYNTFCIVRVIRIHTTSTVPFTAEEFNNYILHDRKHEQVTVIFDKWFGAWYVPQKFGLSSVCESCHETVLQGNLRPSKLLQRHAAKYEQLHAGGDRPFRVSVMIRSEHLLHTLPYNSMCKNITQCLQEAIKVTRSIQEKMKAEQPFLTVDTGRYGSASFKTYRFKYTNLGRKAFYHLVKTTFEDFFQKSYEFSEWEDTFTAVTDGIEDRGYIAAIQRTIASRADCIVLVGGGQFLKVALHEYLDFHNQSEWCIHFVCVGGRYEEEYQEILQNARKHAG